MYSVFVTVDPNTGDYIYSVDYTVVARTNEIESGFETRQEAWDWVNENS